MCRVNKWSTFQGFLGQYVVHIVGSISGPHNFSIKIVVSEDFCKPSLQRGPQSFRRFLVF